MLGLPLPIQISPRYVLGVQPTEPGYAALRVEPYPADLTWAKGVRPHRARRCVGRLETGRVKLRTYGYGPDEGRSGTERAC